MGRILEISGIVILLWSLLSIGFAAFWVMLKRREPEIEEPEDAYVSEP